MKALSKTLAFTCLVVFFVIGSSMGVHALTTTSYMGMTLVDLGDDTVESPNTPGYTGNINIENLEKMLTDAGITNSDNTQIDSVDDQKQYELFYNNTGATLTYALEFVGIGFAAYHSPFGVFTYDTESDEVTFQDPLFVQNEVPENTTYYFDIADDSYFGFYLDSNNKGKKLLTMHTMNPANFDHPDNIDHALFYETNKGITIAFEDIINSGDSDYEDLVVNVRATPEPATMALLGLGLIGLAGLKRRIG